MMQRRLFFSLLAALVSLVARAETPAEAALPKGTIRGRVVDADSGLPLIGTTIIIEGTPLGTVADMSGGFTISNITPGRVLVTASYLGYEVFRQTVDVAPGGTVEITIALRAEGIDIEDVVVVARIDNESENVQLSGQKEALAAIQSVGAAEMSRKGIGNAQAAVAQISGIAKQEGVKNVFVRGLGDRYNATTLNGFPLPSEEAEYKNISLEFFGSDVIQSIGVNKVFGARLGGDVGGAAIDIRSKRLAGAKALKISVEGGANSAVAGTKNFRQQDGVNVLGMSRTAFPSAGEFDFANKLDPRKVAMPMDHSLGIVGGRRWMLGANPLSVLVVASHGTDYGHRRETVRSTTAEGVEYQNFSGERSTVDIDQLVLAGVDFNLSRRHFFEYNALIVHANKQYVGQWSGVDPRYSDADDQQSGLMRRQQSNDNLLIVNQLSAKLNVADRWQVNLGAAYNSIRGTEPDRRENNMSLVEGGRYIATGSNRQRRFFSELREGDLNLRASVSYRLSDDVDLERSNVTLGYRARLVNDDFEAREYSYGKYRSATATFAPDVALDELYNAKTAFTGDEKDTPDGRFYLPEKPLVDSYTVDKHIHAGFVEATHRLTDRLAANMGLAVDAVTMNVAHKARKRDIDKLFWLPSISLKYDPAEKHSLRLGVSKTYTLPQSKEISDYQYVDISFASQGNLNLKPSDNYNVDVKWDFYPSSSELVSIGVFGKRIAHPIGRVDQGNSARLLTYDNLGKKADVAGVEAEIRKNIFNTTTIRQSMRRLSVGLSASWIHSVLEMDVVNTPRRKSALEGASPWLVNGDISYNYSTGNQVINVALVASWFADRIHTLGTQGYEDTMEEGAANLALVTSMKMGKRWTLKMKAANLPDPPNRLTRKTTNGEKIVLSEHRKGVDVSVGVSFDIF